MELKFDKEITIAISGEAGQGIDTITQVIAEAVKTCGYNVFYTKEYMSRIKGGCNSSSIRISSEKVSAYKENIDFAFIISEDAFHLFKRLNWNTVILYEYENEKVFSRFDNSKRVDFISIAKEFGSSIYVNAVVSGIVMGILCGGLKALNKSFEKTLSGKTDEIKKNNEKASEKGYEIGRTLVIEKNIQINIKKDSTVEKQILINGNDSAAIGCLAGGVDFVSSYPMSPSTGILTFMAKHSQDFNIIVEQAEDEIAAINMGLGAWFAGARAMTTTSGGGFSLMCEAVSLAGMTETPMVIYIGQRPGPATGLPTRTEQGDLNLALYSGHGEFPRIILTPSTLDDCFFLSQRAFNLADKFQVPVFILSDQYLVDSCYNTQPFEFEKIEIVDFIGETSADYKRYKFTQSGISLRGVPSYGEGFVVVDSDEHDEDGHITEDLDIRAKMMEKRMSKTALIKKDSVWPEFYGKEASRYLVISWGSTFNAVKEALDLLDNPDVSLLHFKQVYPLNDVLLYYLNRKTVICVENNYSGQFANLLKLEFDIDVDVKILKYNGMPFSVEELTVKLNEVLK